MGAIAYEYERRDTGDSLTGNLRDVWNGGYFWRDLFVKGADNRLLLTRVVDQLTTVALQMSERRTAINDLAGYYTHITGEEFPQDQRQRLNAWVSAGYDPRDYPILSELALRINHDKERPLDDAKGAYIGNNPCAINGRRKGPMIIASIDDYE
ncbi:hypothetical protein NYE27_21180 [Paenibacillus sp. FSL R10-2779]|uniref:hypothetical protein n=1 Tax=Paenibacillus sp. FSL R10-2779 TaxID=2975340 RepID=UPI0030F7AE84